jgi:hypothetical protein
MTDTCLGEQGRDIYIYIERERDPFWVNYLYPCHHLIQGVLKKPEFCPPFHAQSPEAAPFSSPNKTGNSHGLADKSKQSPHIINMVSGIPIVESTQNLHRAYIGPRLWSSGHVWPRKSTSRTSLFLSLSLSLLPRLYYYPSFSPFL